MHFSQNTVGEGLDRVALEDPGGFCAGSWVLGCAAGGGCDAARGGAGGSCVLGGAGGSCCAKDGCGRGVVRVAAMITAAARRCSASQLQVSANEGRDQGQFRKSHCSSDTEKARFHAQRTSQQMWKFQCTKGKSLPSRQRVWQAFGPTASFVALKLLHPTYAGIFDCTDRSMNPLALSGSGNKYLILMSPISCGDGVNP
jgi:hypothetical protein